MKKIFISMMGLTFLLISLSAFADPLGAREGKTGQISAEQQKFLQETKDLRKERHDIRCQLMEASQTANPDEEKIAGLRKELSAVRTQIQAKAADLGVTTGAGKCADSGMGGNCGQKRQLNCSGTKQVNSTQ